MIFNELSFLMNKFFLLLEEYICLFRTFAKNLQDNKFISYDVQ
jgi:hypothetical protein